MTIYEIAEEIEKRLDELDSVVDSVVEEAHLAQATYSVYPTKKNLKSLDIALDKRDAVRNEIKRLREMLNCI